MSGYSSGFRDAWTQTAKSVRELNAANDRLRAERDVLQARVFQLTAAYNDLDAHQKPGRLEVRVDQLTTVLAEMAAEFGGDRFNAARCEAALAQARAVLGGDTA